MSHRVRFKDFTSAGLAAALAPHGASLRLARRLQAAVIGGGSFPSRLDQVSPRLLDRVREATEIPRLTRLEKRVSPVDGFAKYLFLGDGADPFEAVCIPLLNRSDDPKVVVCVSSQVGCAMRCAFCATGQMGHRRNLSPWEIVDQVLHIRADTEHPVRGVVFMGMGEPMLNYESVMTAAAILSEPCGGALPAKGITISTVGIVPRIRAFTAENRPYKLVVSITSADPQVRVRLLPAEETYPLAEIIDALRERHARTGTRVTLAWTLIAGVNTSVADARLIAEATRGLPFQLDLIDVNDPSGRFRPPGDAERNAFRDALREHVGVPVIRRYSGGQDIGGGCGMLAGGREPAAPK